MDATPFFNYWAVTTTGSSFSPPPFPLATSNVSGTALAGQSGILQRVGIAIGCIARPHSLVCAQGVYVGGVVVIQAHSMLPHTVQGNRL